MSRGHVIRVPVSEFGLFTGVFGDTTFFEGCSGLQCLLRPIGLGLGFGLVDVVLPLKLVFTEVVRGFDVGRPDVLDTLDFDSPLFRCKVIEVVFC